MANALGAVTGTISAASTVEIRPASALDGPTCYDVFGPGGVRRFEDLDQAERCAAAQARRLARAEAARRGASGRISVSVRKDRKTASTQGSDLYLGTTVTARAVGGSFPEP